jgi:hypothetical protein
MAAATACSALRWELARNQKLATKHQPAWAPPPEPTTPSSRRGCIRSRASRRPRARGLRGTRRQSGSSDELSPPLDAQATRIRASRKWAKLGRSFEDNRFGLGFGEVESRHGPSALRSRPDRLHQPKGASGPRGRNHDGEGRRAFRCQPREERDGLKPDERAHSSNVYCTSRSCAPVPAGTPT